MNSLTFEAFDNYALGDYSSAVRAEAQINVFDASYSSFLCLLAPSTVIGQPIESYFPIVNDDQSDVKDLRKFELICNGCIMPKESISQNDEKFTCFNVPVCLLNICTPQSSQRGRTILFPCFPLEN